MELNRSYSPGYFSLQDILATQERVPCNVEKDLKDIGFLDPGSENVDLAQGTKLELPYWMVEVRKHSSDSSGELLLSISLYQGLRTNIDRNYVTVEVPKTLKEGFREIMSADPGVVDLHKIGPYYYEFARHLMKLTPAEGEAIGKSITQTFMRRFRDIMVQAENSSDTDTIKVCWWKEPEKGYI